MLIGGKKRGPAAGGKLPTATSMLACPKGFSKFLRPPFAKGKLPVLFGFTDVWSLLLLLQLEALDVANGEVGFVVFEKTPQHDMLFSHVL